VRILAWNVAHQTRESPFKPRFRDAISALAPDILVLNEYVHGATRSSFLDWLSVEGMSHHAVSTRFGKNNQILIASRWPVESGDLSGPSSDDDGGRSNFLHLFVPAIDIELVGLRVPAYESRRYLRAYWTRLVGVIATARERKIIFVGDFNADPDAAYHVGAKQFADLRNVGWQLPVPAGDRSYKSGTRIDHVVASSRLPPVRATYVDTVEGINLCGAAKNAVSDHAPIIVEFVSPRPIP